MLRLYRILLRPLLGYCDQFWSPSYGKDIIERVRKRFTPMLSGMKGLNYKERLDRLGLLSLEQRRLRGDLIEFYKIMRSIDRVNAVMRLFQGLIAVGDDPGIQL
eukprot:g45861.t1